MKRLTHNYYPGQWEDSEEVLLTGVTVVVFTRMLSMVWKEQRKDFVPRYEVIMDNAEPDHE